MPTAGKPLRCIHDLPLDVECQACADLDYSESYERAELDREQREEDLACEREWIAEKRALRLP